MGLVLGESQFLLQNLQVTQDGMLIQETPIAYSFHPEPPGILFNFLVSLAHGDSYGYLARRLLLDIRESTVLVREALKDVP